MRKIYVYSGAPGSGKSYYAVNHCVADGDIYLSRDLLRDELRSLYNTKKYFPAPLGEEYRLWITRINFAIAQHPNANIHIDQTTLTIKSLQKFLNNVHLDPNNDILSIFIFLTPLDQCLKNNALRTGYACVADKIITAMYQDFVADGITLETAKALYPQTELRIIHNEH